MGLTKVYLMVLSTLMLVYFCAGANLRLKRSDSGDDDPNIDAIGRCKTARNWKDDCNSCWCEVDGVPACTLKGCFQQTPTPLITAQIEPVKYQETSPVPEVNSTVPRVYILHENPLWLPSLTQAFDRQGLPWSELFLDVGTFDLSAPPPDGVFFNRMSGSSHTRNHRYSVELTAGVLAWLKRWGRKVVNSQSALDMEVNKVRQYAELVRLGIKTPHTVFVAGRDQIVSAAKKHFAGQPFILKPNRGGKGEGVQLFKTVESLAQYVQSDKYEISIDGVELLQEYIIAPRTVTNRAEFVNGRFLYAVEVDASDRFQMCPSPCENTHENSREKFKIIDEISEQLQTQLESFLTATQIDIAGIEFITDINGNHFVYDVNTNTNYNAEAEDRAGRAGTERSGAGAVAAYLSTELHRLYSTNGKGLTTNDLN